MDPNKNPPPGIGMGWLNIIWNVCQTATFFMLHFQQSNQQTYDRNRLETDRNRLETDRSRLETEARGMKADVSERFGSTNERIRGTQRNLGIAAGLGAGAALLLFKGGNKAIQKLKNEQNTKVDQLNNDVNKLKTKTEAELKQAQETAQKIENELQTQLKQTQDSLQVVSNDLQGKLEATAKGGSATGGNISIDSGLFGRMHQAEGVLIDRRIEEKIEVSVGPRFRTIESKVERLNTKFVKMNVRSSQPVSDSDSSRESMGYFRRSLVNPMSATYAAGSSVQYAGLVPQDTDIYVPSLTAPARLTEQEISYIEKQKLELQKKKAEIEQMQKILNERLEFAPPESDAAVKNKPFKKDDHDYDDSGNPGMGPSTSSVEVNYLFISNNVLINQPILNKSFVNTKSFQYNLFPSKNYIKPIYGNANIIKKITVSNNKLNDLNNCLIPKQNINYNPNNYLDYNLNSNLENKVDITIIDKSNDYSNNSHLLNNNKLLNIVTINGTAINTSSSIEENIETYNNINKINDNIIKSSKILNLNKQNLNKQIVTNDNLESFPISDLNINKSLTENDNIIELTKVRQILHNNWLDYKIQSYPLMDSDIDQSVIDEIVNMKIMDDSISIIKQPNYLINNNLDKNHLYINNNIKNNLYLNNNIFNIESVFVSHKLYIDFLDILFCELFFNSQIININISCFIYGSLFMPTLFIFNALGYIITSVIFITTVYFINNGFDIVLKNNFSYINYLSIKNILNKSYSIFFNSLFLYILFINITNVSVVSNLILLKSTTLYGNKLLQDFNKSNHTSSNQLFINKTKFLNPYIYKEKYYF